MFFEQYLAKFSWLDWAGLSWFLVCWLGYEMVVERGWIGRRTLHEETHKLRLAWGRVMLGRNQRIVDVALIGNLLQSLSFYANTSIYIIAALFAALGTLDQLMAMASELPFSRAMSKEATEIKLLILIGVFVVAYFKFTWSLRQFNLLSITLGSVPQEAEEDLDRHARKFAAVNTCAGNDFNRGLRAYYFGMAVMSWMVSPWLFICSTLVIVFVLARREFSSPVLKALTDV
ncbi:DUF599 domain-containing protein [Propionivibrio sp.]|jgi:uncharacterized membrane protein|uniref:DUF599 domain-containing protein n=1 Tax=Propionivibrio sp. TaxID=2212460 RepID=UPI0039E2D0C4